MLFRGFITSPLKEFICCGSFTCDLYEWEISIVGTLLDQLKDVFVSSSNPDSRVWCPLSLGIFFTKVVLFHYCY